MQIQVNTDNTINGSEGLQQHVEQVAEGALGRFSDRITRLEVHLQDVNGEKNTANDHHCTMEARLSGLQPVAVTHDADTLDAALEGAARKLTRMLDSTLGKLADTHRRPARGAD